MRNPPHGVKGVVSDFDGTLVDSERFHMIAWDAVRIALGIREPIDFTAFIGTSDVYVAETLIREYALSLTAEAVLERKSIALAKSYDERLVAFPGVIETLAILNQHGIAIFVATSSRRTHVEEAARRTGVDAYLKGFVTSEDVRNRKPAPDAYLLAVEKLGAAKEFVIAIEDSPTGVASAKRAGLYTFAVANSFPKRDLAEADCIIDRFDEILAVME